MDLAFWGTAENDIILRTTMEQKPNVEGTEEHLNILEHIIQVNILF